MGHLTIGFPNGRGISFRIDPNEVGWNFQVNTSVTNTVGGRVVQVTGATLSDIVISGLFGEDRSLADGTAEYPGRSWRLAYEFSERIRDLMTRQSRDAHDQTKMHPALVFDYPPEGWKFRVYIKDFRDPDGGAIRLRPGKFSHGYVLTLFVVQDGTADLIQAGDVNGVISLEKAKAIDSYIKRISQGMGWTPSAYNGDFRTYYDDLFGHDVAHRGESGVNDSPAVHTGTPDTGARGSGDRPSGTPGGR